MNMYYVYVRTVCVCACVYMRKHCKAWFRPLPSCSFVPFSFFFFGPLFQDDDGDSTYSNNC